MAGSSGSAGGKGESFDRPIQAGEEGPLRRHLHDGEEIAPVVETVEQAVLTCLAAVVGQHESGMLQHAHDQCEDEVSRQGEVAHGVMEFRLSNDDVVSRGCTYDRRPLPPCHGRSIAHGARGAERPRVRSTAARGARLALLAEKPTCAGSKDERSSAKRGLRGGLSSVLQGPISVDFPPFIASTPGNRIAVETRGPSTPARHREEVRASEVAPAA
jgi:hypothetical protein